MMPCCAVKNCVWLGSDGTCGNDALPDPEGLLGSAMAPDWSGGKQYSLKHRLGEAVPSPASTMHHVCREGFKRGKERTLCVV